MKAIKQIISLHRPVFAIFKDTTTFAHGEHFKQQVDFAGVGEDGFGVYLIGGSDNCFDDPSDDPGFVEIFADSAAKAEERCCELDQKFGVGSARKAEVP